MTQARGEDGRLGRALLRPPRLHDDEQARRATWLELFFDLVFVVAVSRLAGVLHDDQGAGGVAVYLGLFVPVWWAWISFSYFGDLFDTDDVFSRCATFAAMVGAAVLAITIEGGVGEDSRLFAATLGVLLALLSALYAYAGRTEPGAAELSRWYVAGSATGATLWLVSLAVPTPGRYVVWALALVLNAAISGPIAYQRMTAAPQQVSHMPERFGLFIIVVLGESVLSVLNGTTETEWHSASTAAAVVGFLTVAGIWWIYFEQFDEELINRALQGGRGTQVRSFVYGYGHLGLYAAIAATGVGVELAIEAAETADGAGPLLPVSVAAYLLILTLVQLAVHQPLSRRVLIARLVAALVALALPATPLPALAAATTIALAVLTVVVLEVLESQP